MGIDKESRLRRTGAIALAVALSFSMVPAAALADSAADAPAGGSELAAQASQDASQPADASQQAAAAQQEAQSASASAQALAQEAQALEEQAPEAQAAQDDQSAAAQDSLDFDNLEDGDYTVQVSMIKTDRASTSMSDAAVADEAALTVKDGVYYLTLDFDGLWYLGRYGYLGFLRYYDEGYTYSRWGSPNGTVVEATVLSTQKDDSGDDVYDSFNDPEKGTDANVKGKLYPDKVQVKIVDTARNATGTDEGLVPLQVYVPVMESISAGTGTQDVFAKIDKSSVAKAGEASTLDTSQLVSALSAAQSALSSQNKTEQAESELSAAIKAAQSALAAEDATQDSIDAAVQALKDATLTFYSASDAEADKTGLDSAISEAESALAAGSSKTDSAKQALQSAIDAAKAVVADSTATDSEIASAISSLTTAISEFSQAAEAQTTLDFYNLEDGTYTINIDMVKMDRETLSMSNDAVNHEAKLVVEGGKYYLTLDFKGVATLGKFGYLKNLSYYDSGYTYNSVGTPQGSVVAATVVDYQLDEDGEKISDDFGTDYPNRATIEVVDTVLSLADGFIPLQVFVPIMEDIAEGGGTQNVLARYDASSVKKVDSDYTPADNVNTAEELVAAAANGTSITATGITKSTVGSTSSSSKSTTSKSTLAKTGDPTSVTATALTAMGALTGAGIVAGGVWSRRRQSKEA